MQLVYVSLFVLSASWNLRGVFLLYTRTPTVFRWSHIRRSNTLHSLYGWFSSAVLYCSMLKRSSAINVGYCCGFCLKKFVSVFFHLRWWFSISCVLIGPVLGCCPAPFVFGFHTFCCSPNICFMLMEIFSGHNKIIFSFRLITRNNNICKKIEIWQVSTVGLYQR